MVQKGPGLEPNALELCHLSWVQRLRMDRVTDRHWVNLVLRTRREQTGRKLILIARARHRGAGVQELNKHFY